MGAPELDAHRKRVQAQHPGLTLTGMYNVLEKLRAGDGVRLCAQHQPQPPEMKKASEFSRTSNQADVAAAGLADTAAPLALTPKEKQIHEQGLVSVLKQLHDDLDAAVFAAYGWPCTLTEAEILARVVALNAERAREEAGGLVRWLRPEYQAAGPRSAISDSPSAIPRGKADGKKLIADGRGRKAEGKKEQQAGLDLQERKTRRAAKKTKRAWPKTLAERVKAVAEVLRTAETALTPEEITQHFLRAKAGDVSAILETLVVMGQARRAKEQGRFVG
jgi:hypothetical protein